MNYQAFTNDSQTMMYEAIRGALAADDALKRQGLATRFRVPPWTPEEDERLRKLPLTGISVAAMAPQHGSGPQPRRPVEDSGGQVA